MKKKIFLVFLILIGISVYSQPNPPTLISPLDSAVDISLYPTFDWADVAGAIYYRIQISTNPLFSNLVLDVTQMTNSSYTLLPGVLNYCTWYYWRVCAINSNGQGQWSAFRAFKTICQIGISLISSEIPAEYKLYNNYPNPFNPVTKIRYLITKNDFTTLKVYDILGKEIETLVNEKLSPGIYEVSFDGSNLPSGMYFYTIRSEDFTDTKRMLLVN